MTLKALIVDDEPLARQLIEGYCRYFPEIEVVGSVVDVFMARPILETGRVDVLFLDINMPVMNGINFLRSLPHKPITIFTTAYKEHAHEAFDLAATDYLLKPFSMERFLQAIDKAKAALKQQPNTPENHTFLKSDGKLIKLFFDELYYVEAQGNQVKFVTKHSTFNITQTFGSVLELLPASQFVRIHRSFAVNIQKISIIESYRILLLQKGEVPLGSNFREDFLKMVMSKGGE